MRVLRGNGHIITAAVLLLVFGGAALSVALNTETAMARIVGQQGSEGYRAITIEFQYEGETYVVTENGDIEAAEGEEVQVWFDGNDPEFIEFSQFGLFLGFYVIVAGLLVYLGIAIRRRVRRGRQTSEFGFEPGDTA